MATAATAGVLVSGTSGTDQSAEDAAAAAGTAQAPGTYGAPLPDRPAPTEVAVDPPRTTSPSGGSSSEDSPDDAGATSPGSSGGSEQDGGRAVFVTYSGYNPATDVVEVAGRVDVVESGGTCTLTVTRGTDSTTISQPATEDVSSTWCGGLAIPRASLSSGTWQAVLGYEAGDATGSADPVQVVVP